VWYLVEIKTVVDYKHSRHNSLFSYDFVVLPKLVIFFLGLKYLKESRCHKFFQELLIWDLKFNYVDF
jgi:hypothetical protein